MVSDCNIEIEFSIPGFGIEKFVIPGSRFGIRLLDWSSFWYPRLTYFMHSMLCRPYGRYDQTVLSDDDCQNTSSTLALIKYFIHQTANIFISII